MKTCALCGESKELWKFHWSNRAKGRRQSYCKPCQCRKQAEYKRLKLGLPVDAVMHRGQKPAEIGSTMIHKLYVLEKVGTGRDCHPRADKNGWVYQHILVAEKKYGMLIPKGFTVHHRNRKHDDNRPENLELRVGPHGKGGDLMPTLLADPELRAQAIVILEQYGDKRNIGKKG